MAKYVVQMSKEGGEPYEILDKTARLMVSGEVTAREAAIAAEVTAREAAIAAEATARSGADNILNYSVMQNTMAAFNDDLMESVFVSSDNIDNNGQYWRYFAKKFPAGVYTLVIDAISTNANLQSIKFSRLTDSYSHIEGCDIRFNLGGTFSYTVEIPEDFGSFIVFAGGNVSDSAGRTLAINRLSLYKGIHLEKDNGVDVTATVKFALDYFGTCVFQKGVYTLDSLKMGNGSILKGSGETILQNKQGQTIPSVSFPTLSGDTFSNYITTSYNLFTGIYTCTINMTSTYDVATSRICFLRTETYHADNIIAEALVERDADYTFTINATDQIKSIFVFGGRNTQTPCEFTVNEFDISLSVKPVVYFDGDDCTAQDLIFRGSENPITLSENLGVNTGIAWTNPGVKNGIITRCKFINMDNSGIFALDTGFPTDHGLMISDCFISGNNIGINIKANSEFNKIINCIISGNYYGVINRGGNNLISNCGIDANVVGLLIDNAEGQNQGHGSVDNCTFNHSDNNTGYGIIISGTGRMMINNCCIYYSKIKLENTNGNVISNCGFGSDAPIEITGGNCSMIIGCIMRTAADTPITLQNNTSAKVVNCFTRDGDEITPTAV